MTPGPVIWIVEDEERHRVLLKQLFTAGFGRCRFREFQTDGAVVAAIANTSAAPPDLVVLDLLLPPLAGLAQTPGLPGLEVLRSLRAQGRTRGTPVIVRSGFPEDVPAAMIDEKTRLFAKGDSPEDLLDVAASMLSVRGFELLQEVDFVSAGVPVGLGPRWLAPVTVVGGSAAAASLWVASVLQVTSPCSNGVNAELVALGLLGGAAAASSRLAEGNLRLAVLALGLFVVLCAGLLAPTGILCG